MVTTLLVKWAVVTVVFIGAAALLPTVKIRSWTTAILAALVFGLLNVLLGWLLKAIFGVLLFLPAVLSFGLAWLLLPVLVNAVLLKGTDKLMGEKFEVPGLFNTLALATAISVAQALFHVR
jgi:putative membrane protein